MDQSVKRAMNNYLESLAYMAREAAINGPDAVVTVSATKLLVFVECIFAADEMRGDGMNRKPKLSEVHRYDRMRAALAAAKGE